MNWKKLAKKYKKNYSHDVFANGAESYMIYKNGAAGLHCDKNQYGTFYNVTTAEAVHDFKTLAEAVNFFERESQHELS